MHAVGAGLRLERTGADSPTCSVCLGSRRWPVELLCPVRVPGAGFALERACKLCVLGTCVAKIVTPSCGGDMHEN